MDFFSSGGTYFSVIGEGLIAIDSLTVGVVDNEVRLFIEESLHFSAREYVDCQIRLVHLILCQKEGKNLHYKVPCQVHFFLT